MSEELTDEKILEAYHDTVIDVEAYEATNEEIAEACAEIEATHTYDEDRSGE